MGVTSLGRIKMNKEQILDYLGKKKALTADAQNVRHEIYVAKQEYEGVKAKFKKPKIGMIVIGILTLFSIVSIAGLSLLLIWAAVFAFLYYRQLQQRKQAQIRIDDAEQKLAEVQHQQEYQDGMNDFPQRFYNYWMIDRLMHLVQENRATSLQEAFNVAENQDFQNDQLSLQQQNLAVAQSTNNMSKISAAANVFTAYNTRR